MFTKVYKKKYYIFKFLQKIVYLFKLAYYNIIKYNYNRITTFINDFYRKEKRKMKCPKCGKTMGVTNTYSGDQVPGKLKYISNNLAQTIKPEQVVIRLRKCAQCAQYYYTAEILDNPIKVNKNMRDTLAKKFGNKR